MARPKKKQLKSLMCLVVTDGTVAALGCYPCARLTLNSPHLAPGVLALFPQMSHPLPKSRQSFLLSVTSSILSGGANACVAPKVKWKLLSCVRLLATPWTVARQAPLSMGFSRQEYWSGLPCRSPGILPTQGLNPDLPHCRQILCRLSCSGICQKMPPSTCCLVPPHLLPAWLDRDQAEWAESVCSLCRPCHLSCTHWMLPARGLIDLPFLTDFSLLPGALKKGLTAEQVRADFMTLGRWPPQVAQVTGPAAFPCGHVSLLFSSRSQWGESHLLFWKGIRIRLNQSELGLFAFISWKHTNGKHQPRKNH